MQIEKLLVLGEAQGIDFGRLAELVQMGTKTIKGGLTGADVHLAMSGLPPEQKAILYLKPNPARISGNDLAALTNHLWMSLIGFEASRRTEPGGEITEAIRKLLTEANAARDLRQARTVRTALAEYEDAKHCWTCKTSTYEGKVAEMVPVLGLVYRPCPDCNGRGWMPWSDNKRANLVGGDRSQWRKRHEPGYLHVLHECTDLYAKGVRTFKERLFGAPKIETKLQARA